VRTVRSVKAVDITEDALRVTFHDGTVEEGSVLVGADGVYNTVRTLMQGLAKGVVLAEECATSFQDLYGIGPFPEGIEAGFVTELSHPSFWLQIIAWPDRLF
jgi:hypothetical protein